MPNYKRMRYGTTYFFTVVTYQRKKILCLDSNRKTLREVIKQVQSKYPFSIDAFVLLPDHLHCIWTLPDGDTDYSMRWGLIKKEFTKQMHEIGGLEFRNTHTVQHRISPKMVGAAHPTGPELANNVMMGKAHHTESGGGVGCAHQNGRPLRILDKTDYNHQITTKSRIKHREGSIWQRRFWEHQIRDQRDFNSHCDYIHYNPVKHGFEKKPADWEYSSFHRYVRVGKYDRKWGAGEVIIFDEAIGHE